MKYDVIIIGAGAAGLMCGIEAGKRGRSVAILEHNPRPGNKILISGGGRCNFTNINATAANYISRNPDFCKSALARYKPEQFIALVEKHGIAYHEKTLGQLFCDNSSKEILAMLMAECSEADVTLLLNHRVLDVKKSAEIFELNTNQGAFECSSLVIATGGLSFANLGATDFGFRLANQFGLGVIKPRPGLVPLTLDRNTLEIFGELSGLSFDVEAVSDAASFKESMLFTHRGLSGPVILQISNYLNPGETLRLNLLPETSAQEFLMSEKKNPKELKTVLSRFFPQRFLQKWCPLNAPSKPMNQYLPTELESIAQALRSWPIKTAGDEGYPKAEVTLGGVDTSELSSKTMETRKVPGLYFIGETVDVTGWLGGYNFQWAWASGHAAGQFV